MAFWSRKNVSPTMDLAPPVTERSQGVQALNATMSEGATLGWDAAQTPPKPEHVYGQFPVEPPEAYTLGEFAPLKYPEHLSGSPVEELWLAADFSVRTQFRLGDNGEWRYRLIPKHAHECCPDCGLDRHRVEEYFKCMSDVRRMDAEQFEKRLVKLEEQIERRYKDAVANTTQSLNALIDGPIAQLQKIVGSEEDYIRAGEEMDDVLGRLAAIEKIAPAKTDAHAPGVYGEVAKVAEDLKGHEDKTATILRGLFEATTALRCDLEQLIKATGCERHVCPEIAARPSRPATTVIRKIPKK